MAQIGTFVTSSEAEFVSQTNDWAMQFILWTKKNVATR